MDEAHRRSLHIRLAAGGDRRGGDAPGLRPAPRRRLRARAALLRRRKRGEHDEAQLHLPEHGDDRRGHPEAGGSGETEDRIEEKRTTDLILED